MSAASPGQYMHSLKKNKIACGISLPLAPIPGRNSLTRPMSPEAQPHRAPYSRGPGHLYIACLSLIILLTACSSNPFSQPVAVHKTPVPAMAAGEPVLPGFQVHFHDAP